LQDLEIDILDDRKNTPYPHPLMRECVVNKSRRGYFHIWVNQDSLDGDGHVISRPYGVVELLSGRVILCMPQAITFIDKK